MRGRRTTRWSRRAHCPCQPVAAARGSARDVSQTKPTRRNRNLKVPTFKGNRGNLLQHWVLAELIVAIQNGLPDGSRLCYIDAHSMSPYAARDENPGQSANDFDRVRNVLPGLSSFYEVAWQVLRRSLNCAYPSSAAFVRQLWTGPLHLLLCEHDRATASEIAQWIGTLNRSDTSWELFRGDWRDRFRHAIVTDHDAYLISFDPYVRSQWPARTAATRQHVSTRLAAGPSSRGAIAEAANRPPAIDLQRKQFEQPI